MSTVAPPRTRPYMPAPLRIRRLSFTKGKATVLPDKDEEPIIPPKSPKRNVFTPLEPTQPRKGLKYTLKALPPVPPSTDLVSANSQNLKSEDDFLKRSSPVKVPTRSNTRLSDASTAVNSQNSGEYASSIPSPASTATVTGVNLPPPPTTPPSPLRRARSASQSALNQSFTPTLASRSSMDPSGRSPTKPPLSTRHKIAQHANMPPSGAGKVTPGQKVKEGAFFALVLLPLSCWYTRGGKRLQELDMKELREEENARMIANGEIPVDQRGHRRGRSVGPPVGLESHRGRSIDETRRVDGGGIRPGTRDGPTRQSIDRSRPLTRGADTPVPRISTYDVRRARAGTMDRVIVPVNPSTESFGRRRAESVGGDRANRRRRSGSLFRDGEGAFGFQMRRQKTNSVSPQDVIG